MNEQGDHQDHQQQQRYQQQGPTDPSVAAAMPPHQGNDVAGLASGVGDAGIFIDERIQAQRQRRPSYTPRHVITSEAQHTRSLPSLPPNNDDVITPQIADAYLAQTLNQLGIDERTRAIEDVHGVSKIIHESSEFIQSCLDKFDKEISNLPPLISTSPTAAGGLGVSGGGGGVDTSSDVPVDPDVGTAVAAPAATDTATNTTTTAAFLNKEAYNMAMAQNPNHVQSLRLSFLRAESFDIQHAAIRMISYFDAKLDLFGPNLLTKDITIQDLEECGTTNQSNDPNVNATAATDSNVDIECLNTGYVQLLPARDRSGRPIVCWIPGLMKDDRIPIESKVRFLSS